MPSLIERLNTAWAKTTDPDEIVAALQQRMGWLHTGSLTQIEHDAIFQREMYVAKQRHNGSWWIVQPPPWKFWFAMHDCAHPVYSDFWVIRPEEYEEGIWPSP
jgi:hypothetical protein